MKNKLIGFVAPICFSVSSGIATAQEPAFTTDFRLADCDFTTEGKNSHFFLKPGYQLLLEGEEDGEEVRLLITVLRKTEVIDLRDQGLGRVKTRVVEEREWQNGELLEISKNFFARCSETDDIYYFGEEVCILEAGECASDEGSWRAGENGAVPGLIMPGTFLLGSRYFQEQAPGVALDRAEHVAMGLMIETSAGAFESCVEVLDTTPLEPGAESIKRYCPGVGLVFDDGVELMAFGYNIFGRPDDDDDDDDDDRSGAVTEAPIPPAEFALFRNHPNPFNPETNIDFQLPNAGHVALKIYDALGHEIRTLADARYEAGYHRLSWDGRDNHGNPSSSGTYFLSIKSGDFVQKMKMSLIR